MRSSKAAAFALALAAFVSLAGCAPAASSTPAATATTVPAATTGAATTTRPVTGDCGEASAARIKQHLAARADVVEVSAQGGCHDALIETTLGANDALKGRDICDLAAEVAYDAGDISSITVVAADSTELSIAIKGQDCIAEL